MCYKNVVILLYKMFVINYKGVFADNQCWCCCEVVMVVVTNTLKTK
jgi:hypothetical protein